nr:MAG TPA: hypothetical protein [Caudoviricetes sp.]
MILGKAVSLLKTGGKALKPSFKPDVSKMNVAMGGLAGYSTYNDSKQEGNSTSSSLVKGAAEFGLGLFGMGTYLGAQAVMNAPEYAIKGYQALREHQYTMMYRGNGTPFQNTMFNETEGAYTMRQAAMNVMKRTQYNNKMAVMGNEAKYMKR